MGAVERARTVVAARSKAAVGLAPDASDGPVRLEVSPREMLRRMVGGRVPLEEMRALEQQQADASSAAVGVFSQCETPAELFATVAGFSMRQVAFALELALELGHEVPEELPRPQLTPLEASGPGGPAFESFKSGQMRPPHGGYPGATS